MRARQQNDRHTKTRAQKTQTKGACLSWTIPVSQCLCVCLCLPVPMSRGRQRETEDGDRERGRERGRERLRLPLSILVSRCLCVSVSPCLCLCAYDEPLCLASSVQRRDVISPTKRRTNSASRFFSVSFAFSFSFLASWSCCQSTD